VCYRDIFHHYGREYVVKLGRYFGVCSGDSRLDWIANSKIKICEGGLGYSEDIDEE
jgi:hypothetical protein